MITRDESSLESIVDKVKLSLTMYPEQQRLIQIFVATLVRDPRFQEIGTDGDALLIGEKIYHYNVVHEICNFGAKGNCGIYLLVLFFLTNRTVGISRIFKLANLFETQLLKSNKT